MALFLPTAPPTTTPPLSAIHHHSFPHLARFCCTSVGRQPDSLFGYQLQTAFVPKEKRALIVKMSADVDGTAPLSESEEENVPIGDLPLESKLQLKLEQKMRMKLAKKIRLRRKKLVRKRRLRKKGRWPPSKLKKNKNV